MAGLTMADRLQGKVALVSGAGSIGPGWGNGKAAAVLYAREGASGFCGDLDLAAAEQTRDLIRGEGGTAEAFRCDVTKADEVAAMAAACHAAFGAIDVLHNNVGILEIGGPVDLTEEAWDRVHDVNLKSMFLTCKHVLPVMEAQGSGAIVNISSVSGLRWTGVPYLSYSTSKAAVNHFTRMVAVQYAPQGIRCNCVLPGLMRTPMVEHALADHYADGDIDKMFQMRGEQVPMGHGGDAWDVAHAALFLASDEAKYITGIELVVDGGLTLKMT